jgi:hypothetical protein
MPGEEPRPSEAALPVLESREHPAQAGLFSVSAPSIEAGPTQTAAEKPPLARPGTVAERFPVAGSVTVGDVLVMIPNNGEEFHPCILPADPMVTGIAITNPQNGFAAVASSGYLLVKADATAFPIAKGDLLVASSTPGHAMKAPRPAEQGTIIGKALEPLQVGTGLIKVLLMLR